MKAVAGAGAAIGAFVLFSMARIVFGRRQKPGGAFDAGLLRIDEQRSCVSGGRVTHWGLAGSSKSRLPSLADRSHPEEPPVR